MTAIEVAAATGMHVLLVEDSPGDVRLTSEAFSAIDPTIKLHVTSDGVEAIAFLWRSGRYADAPRPAAILLDLNLPKMDGREVLAQIKKDDHLKAIPVVVLTTSERPADIARSYELHANCYLRKPRYWDAFESLVRGVHAFWLSGSEQPLELQAAE
jgi:chemotaxis family two-component system response regulator Rcp1